MASKIRSRRTVIAAGVMSLALVAPLSPALSENPSYSLPSAAAATVNDFNPRYTTENAFGKKKVLVEGLQLAPGDTVSPRTALTPTINPDYTFENINGQLYVVREKEKPLEAGEKDISIFFQPAGGSRANTTLKLTVVNSQSWDTVLSGFEDPGRPSLDFTEGPVRAETIKLPADAKISVTSGGWTVTNDQGVARITAPRNYEGNDADVDIPVRITLPAGDQVDRTIQIRATKPAPQNLPTWARLLGDFLAKLIGGATGAGGAGGGGGSSLPAGLFDGLIRVTVNADNASINVTGNGVIHPGAISGNGVIQDGAISGNGVIQEGGVVGAAPGAIAPSAVMGVAPGALGSSSKAKNDSGNGGDSAAKNKLKDPKCIASLVGFGVPAAILIPVLLSNILRIPGFEGIQDAMKVAAASMGPGLNISPEQLAAGVGGFAGAGAVAGLIASITQCVPSKEEKAAASASAAATSTPTSAAPAREPKPAPAA
ncbi:hypothetical protein [Corynebacterium urinipleomorphum]|uniref:hypothetical protein n=1 Tax=Corynebacterium urinipleomorphum TaxID=1852380 RepID=UPI001177F963|nr:hypothetical protein [Corynebacterium urinipleomorphum]